MGVMARDVAVKFALGRVVYVLEPPTAASVLLETFFLFVGVVDVYRIVFRVAT